MKKIQRTTELVRSRIGFASLVHRDAKEGRLSLTEFEAPPLSSRGKRGKKLIEWTERLLQVPIAAVLSIGEPRTVEAMTMHEVPQNMRNHILIFAFHQTHFMPLIQALRAQGRRSAPIVIVHSEATRLLREDWNFLKYFQRVYFMNGETGNYTTLASSGFQRAAKVVVLTSAQSNEEAADRDALLSYIEIAKSATGFCTIELIHDENVKFLRDGKASRQPIAYRYPAFAEGKVVSANVLNTLLAQSFFNPLVVALVKLLTYQRPIDQLSSQLYQVQLPLAGYSYGDAFELLSNQGIIPIALYRWREKTKTYYVVTNPMKTMEVAENDRFFILSRVDPADLNLDLGAIDE